MRRGCISLGEIVCDECHRIILPAERYLAIDEEEGAEVDKGKMKRYCVACSLEKGYAEYKEDKGEKTLTFFFPETK